MTPEFMKLIDIFNKHMKKTLAIKMDTKEKERKRSKKVVKENP